MTLAPLDFRSRLRSPALGLAISLALGASGTELGVGPDPDAGQRAGAGRIDNADANALRDANDLLEFCSANADQCAVSVYEMPTGRQAHQYPGSRARTRCCCGPANPAPRTHPTACPANEERPGGESRALDGEAAAVAAEQAVGS